MDGVDVLLGYSSFDVSKRLYELSAWPGDVDWADWLPLSATNYPAYTCGYLIRQLEQGIMTFHLNIDPFSTDRYKVIYRDGQSYAAEAVGLTLEDAVVRFCITLWEHGKFG